MSPTKRATLSKLMRWSNSGTKRRKCILSDEKKTCIIDYLKSAGISCAKPGNKDQVHVRKDENGVWQYEPKYQLLWTLKEILSTPNINTSTEKSFFTEFGEKLKFSTSYRLVKERKELYYQDDIPELSYLCEKYENLNLLSEGIKKFDVQNLAFLFQVKDMLRIFAAIQ